MEQFHDLVEKKGVVSALRDEAAAALSHPAETINALKKPATDAALTVGALYLAHRFGRPVAEEGVKLLKPLAKELGASFNVDAFSQFGPKLALADGMHLAEHQALTSKLFSKGLKATDNDLLHKPLEMTSTGSTGGGGAANFRSWLNSAGEREHSFENVQVGTNTNFYPHADGSKVFFHRQGGLFMQFPNSAETRMVDMGKPITSVHIKEGANGVNEYRFNGEKQMGMLINPRTHDIVAYPANGDKVFIADNYPNGIDFTHSAGGRIHVATDGQINIMPPGRQSIQTAVNQPFKQAYFTEHPDGSASLRFSAQDGKMIMGEVTAQPSLMGAERLPETLRKNDLTPQQRSGWRSPMQRNSPHRFNNSNNVDFDRYDAGARGHHDALNPFNIPMSPERAIDARITGVSGGMVSGNSLDAPADMFAAQWADGNRWMGRWLINMGKPEY